MAHSTRRILLIPMLAQGHFIPFMELAKHLDRRTGSGSITITIVTTPVNACHLRAAIPSSSAVEVAELEFNPTDHGLPPGYENTNAGPPRFIGTLLKAVPSLQPALDRLVEDFRRRDGRLPLCIISDPLTIFSMQTSRTFGIIHAVFEPIGAHALVIAHFIHSHVVPLLKAKDLPQDHVFTIPNFPGVSFDQTQIDNNTLKAVKDDHDPSSYSMKNLLRLARESDVTLVNTVEGLESKALDYLRRSNMYKKLLVVGPLLASPPNLSTEEDSTIMASIRWLNLHPPNSVFYVSFGSEQTLYPWQMTELAKGLEESGRPFVWVLRPPRGLEGEFKSEWLPEGFEERVTMGEPSQGLLLKKWAPQVAILSHESAGAFLSHCAWNSVLEGIIHGQPIVCWPMAHEQFSNSMLAVEELGVGVELARKADAKIEALAVARAVEVVLDEGSEKGRDMRKRARQLAEVMRAAAVEDEGCKGSSPDAIDKFIELVQKNA